MFIGNHPLAEGWKFNKSFHGLIFIWLGVRSAGAHAPRQGFCPRPCSCHSPSGPPPLSASGSIPTFCPAPSQPWGFSAPPPSQIPPPSCSFLPRFPGNLPDWGQADCQAGGAFPGHPTPSPGCFEFSLWLLLLLLLQKYCVSSLNVLLIIGCL